MNATLIAQLLVQFGLPLTQQLFALRQKGDAPLTQEDFDALTKLAGYRSSDSLAAAGIAIVDGKVVHLPPSPVK